MATKESIARGANQTLFSFLPGQLVEYPGANAVVLVKNWGSIPSEIPSKKRILEKLYKAANIEREGGTRYRNVDRAFPKRPDINLFWFGEPHMVFCDLFPLVFTEADNNRAHIFRNVSELNLFLKKWDGGKLMQRDLVFISDDGQGDMEQLQPIVDVRKRPLKLEKYGASQDALRWVDATTGEVLGRVFGILNGKRINVGTPARARRTFNPQIILLVNIREYIDVEDSEKEALGALILARYIYGSAEKMGLPEAFDKIKKTKGMPFEDTAREILEKLGMDFDSLPEKQRKELLSVDKSGMDQAKIEMSKVRGTFTQGEILTALDELYEYSETANSKTKVTLPKMLEDADSEARKAAYRQFISKLNDIGIASATYVEDVPIINLAYGYVRGEFEAKKTLRVFPTDEFDKTGSKVPLYLTQMKTEGLLLEFDRKRIIDFLAERGTINELPEKGKEKEWFIKNIDPTLITRFAGVEEEGPTKEVFSLIHTISHALMKQIPDQCGIGIDQIGEVLFPSIPAILIFSREVGEFRLGALKDLFENKIYPWVDLSFRASRPGSCIYDPVCFHGDGACHLCQFLNEISCGYFNQGLSRHIVFGSRRKKTKGFWDCSLRKF